jgi:hypothetical protein
MVAGEARVHHHWIKHRYGGAKWLDHLIETPNAGRVSARAGAALRSAAVPHFGPASAATRPLPFSSGSQSSFRRE